MSQRFLFDRRSGADRRKGGDKRKNPRLDLPHKRRRQKADRRQQDRTMCEDFYAAKTAPRREQTGSHPQTKH